MRDYILRNISAIYYTDANGVTVQCNLLDSDGISLLSGQPVEPPTLGPAIADRVYVVGSAPVTIDLSQRFIGASGYGMSPTNIPGVTRSGAIVTIDPATTRPTTAITVSGTNTAGTATMTFNLTVNAVSPTLTTPLPDRSLTVGDAAVTLALGDFFANAASYSVSPTGQGVSISGSTLTISAAAERNGTYTVTASNSTGQTVSDDFALVVAASTAIDAVVMMGASLKNSMFGKSLTTANSTATSLLAAEGHNLPVYGWATNGAQLDDAVLHYNEIRAAFPNALILCHLLGGGNITSVRPYPGGQAEFDLRLAELAAAAEGDTRFYPASITFRDYDDTTFINPDNGSKPYNENIIIPWIAANFPHAMAPYGRPKLDYYRRTILDFETWLQTDNIHLTATGVTQFREWIIARAADLLEGVTPAEITERVYVAPPVTDYPLSIINFTGETFASEFQAPRNNVFGNATTVNPNPLPDILDVNGATTGLSMSHAYTGSPNIGATAPGRGSNSNGNIGGLPAYNGTLLSSNIVGASAYITTGVTMLMTISGAVPGAQYEFGMVGSRNAAEVRETTVTIAGTATTWNTSEATPQERRVTVTAAGDGTIPIVVAPAGAALAYLGGLSIRRL